MGKKLIVLFLLISLLSLGCVRQDIKDNQVYLVQQDTEKSANSQNAGEKFNTEGKIPFKEYEITRNEKRVLLTISPNGKELFFMEPFENMENSQVIKGSPDERVRILKVNQDSLEEKVIKENAPFISLVQWDNTGTFVALGGGRKLIIYDLTRDQLLLEDKLQNEAINYFFWSPKDESKIYTENPSLSNGSIYYISSQKKVEAYETREQVYFKGNLDNEYYYATKWFTLSSKDIKQKNKGEGMRTIIADKKGNTVKVLGEGRFRDSYKKSLLQIGDSGFGLYYTQDINRSDGVKILTEEYVFDAKFVDDGKIAYIVANKDMEENLFFLFIVDKNGKEIKKVKVSGSSIALLPNGKTGYIGGPLWEKISFSDNQIEEGLVVQREKTDTSKEEIIKTLRKAIDILYKFELNGVKDYAGAKKYFIDTASPDQWAYFDVLQKFKDTLVVNNHSNKPYIIQMEVKKLKMNSSHDQASALVLTSAVNSIGGDLGMEYALELCNIDNNWYVTGLSTFPNSKQKEDLEKIIKDNLAAAQKGRIFPGELVDKEVEVGQIQFWTSSFPHLSPDVESASYCKVYLKVTDKGKTVIMKMILDKKNQNYWKPTKLSKGELSGI